MTEFQTDKLHIEIDEQNGSIVSIRNASKSFLAEGEKEPIFIVKLLDADGEAVRYSAKEAESVSARWEGNALILTFRAVGGENFNAEVRYTLSDADGMLHLTMSFENNTDKIVEWVDFGSLLLPNDLKGNGGEAEIFSSIVEGGIFEDLAIREEYTTTRYREIGYGLVENDSSMGLYPRSEMTQFMAYLSPQGSLYYGAHDGEANIKQFEVYQEPKSALVRMEHRVFSGGNTGHYTLPYDIVIGIFDGDWHDAAEIYRSWYKSSALCPEKIEENKMLPAWMDDSPVIIIYSVRGVKDTENMAPNCYYPFAEGVKYVNDMAERLGCRVMALMMHWEGTAPWSPPFVWPPFGGEEGFAEAVKALHDKGNLVGVYCSGIGWTTESYLIPDYKSENTAPKLDIEPHLCVSSKGELEDVQTLGRIRKAYEICPSQEIAAEIAVREIEKIAEADVDYCQFFDQDWGGNSKFCYSKEHGHPGAPGKWQNDAMLSIQKRANAKIRSMGREMILGAEGAAAEPFIPQLPFNDLRFFKWFYYGRPVPALSYVTHEYTNNFAGNSCGIGSALDLQKSPEGLAYTIGYAFAAGNMLSIILGPDGVIHWGWCVDWAFGSPKNQEALWDYVAHLNAWRRGQGKPYLRYGKMEKPEEIQNAGTFTLWRKNGTPINVDGLLTTKWSHGGKSAQFIVNYNETEKSFTIEKDIMLYEKPDGEGKVLRAGENIRILPMHAVMAELV